MNFRHEVKFEITQGDLLILRNRLRAVATPDMYARNGVYYIRSLYFDTPFDSALREKADGVNEREKFRLRYYNGDNSLIKLEKKSKINGLCQKKSTLISPELAGKIASGEKSALQGESDALLCEFYTKTKTRLLLPKTLVDYTREPFIFPAGNVRVTFDYNIRTGLYCTDFLDPDCITVPAAPGFVLMEVKYDEFLPDIIRDAVFCGGRRVGAFSKYAACRIFG